MLRVRLDINLNVVDELVIVRDRSDFGNVRSYNVMNSNNHKIGRVENFDSARGAWQLVREALNVIGDGFSKESGHG